LVLQKSIKIQGDCGILIAGEIKAHKFLLSLVSEVFRQQFFGNFPDLVTVVSNVPGQVLRIRYTGSGMGKKSRSGSLKGAGSGSGYLIQCTDSRIQICIKCT
jgi:hypothetical protein